MSSSETADWLLLGGLVVTMNNHWTVIDDGAVAVQGADILEVGEAADLAPRYRSRANEVLDTTGRLVTPGLLSIT